MPGYFVTVPTSRFASLVRKAPSLRRISTVEAFSPFETPPLEDQDHDQDDEDKVSISNGAYWNRKIHSLCTTQSNVDAALNLLDRLRLRGYMPTSLNLSSIVHALCQSGRFWEAHRRLLLSFASPSFSLDHRTSNVLLARLLDANKPSLTSRLLDRMISVDPTFIPSVTNYNRLIDQLCLDSKPVEARRLLDNMLNRGHNPNAVSYTSLINGYCRICDLDAARHLLDEMLERAIAPNPLTYSILLRGVFRKRKVEEGKQLMYDLWNRMLEEEDSTVNNAAFANLIDALCREGFFHEVFRIAEEMPQGKSVCEEFAYGQMIDSLCRAGRNHGASRIVYIMRKRGFFPSLVSYNSIIHGLSTEHGCMRAYQLFKEGIEFGYSPTEPTYKVLVESLCQEFDLCKAKDMLEFMLRREGVDKTRIYNIYLNALCFVDNPSEILNTLVLMLQNQCQPDVVTLNTVIHGFCKMGRVDEAMKILDDMLAGNFCGPDVVTFTTMVSGLLNVGRTEETLLLFHHKMSEAGCTPNVVTYNALFRGLCKNQKIDVMMGIFNGMLAKGVTADSTTYTIILDGLFGSGKIDEAKKFWDDIVWTSKVQDDFVYAAILRGLCNAGRLNEACDFLYELVDCGVSPKIVNYNIVIDGACNLGLKREAYQIMREMRKNGLAPDAVTWRTLDKLPENAKKRCGVSIHSAETVEGVGDSAANTDLEDDIKENQLKRELDKDSLEGVVDSFFIAEERREEKDGRGNGHLDRSDLAREKERSPQLGQKEPLSRIARRVFGLL